MRLALDHWWKGLVRISAGIWVALSLGGCPPTGRKPISLTSDSPASRKVALNQGKQAILVGIAPVISPRETLSSYSELVDYIGEELHCPARVVQRSTYADTNQLVREGLCDVAFVCSLAYVRGNKDFGMEALVVPQVRGKTTYQSYVIVPGDSPARSLKDLKGKSFAFVDPMSNTGWLSPVHLIRQMGANPKRFFSKTIYTYGHDNSLRCVADKLVDGAAVDSLVYTYMQDRHDASVNRVRILCRSETFGIPPVVVSPDTDPALKAKLRTLFLTMHRRGRGPIILSRLMIDKFVPPDLSSYKSIRSTMESEER